jgi:DnaK suppressor protein
MEEARAAELLRDERSRVETLLAESSGDALSDRDQANESGDIADPAERLTAAQVDDALVAGLRSRLAAIERAEGRLAAGTYGRSIRSGAPIPDARLEADPAAELTVEEAASE